jgi:lysozyme
MRSAARRTCCGISRGTRSSGIGEAPLLTRLAIALGAIALLAAGAWLYAIHWHPSDTTYSRQGIDVSRHQGAIDWAALPAQGVDFAYIKASEGGDHRDPRFSENWLGAKAARIPRGAYHFFTLCRTGAEQARNFIATVPADPDMLPPAVDLEFGGNCDARPTPDALIDQLMVFLRTVEARYRRPVTLYLTREFDAGYEVSARIPRPLWLRSRFAEPGWGARPWTMWQASGMRRIAGIEGPVDWDAMRR